jgi:hypothetical protein
MKLNIRIGASASRDKDIRCLPENSDTSPAGCIGSKHVRCRLQYKPHETNFDGRGRRIKITEQAARGLAVELVPCQDHLLI